MNCVFHCAFFVCVWVRCWASQSRIVRYGVKSEPVWDWNRFDAKNFCLIKCNDFNGMVFNEFGRIQWKSYTLLEITRHIPSTGSGQTSSILLLFANEPTNWQLNFSMRVIGQSTALLNRLFDYNESEKKIFANRKTDQLIRR